MGLTNIFNIKFQHLKKLTSNFFISNAKTYHFSADHYKNREVALLTQHGKESVLAPLLKESIGCTVTRVEGYDTDLLGTFSRDIPRSGTQIEAARKKARIGMELARLPVGLASEGSFGPDPFTGMFSWNVELLIWIDTERDLEIIAIAEGKTNLAHVHATEWKEAEAFAEKIGFPEHYLIVRPNDESDERFRKGISDWSELKNTFEWAKNLSHTHSVFIETDMRAHANPTRMHNIRLAGEELVKKIESKCPECGAPGFWLVERIKGLPCRECKLPTNVTRAEKHACSVCAHRTIIQRADRIYAEPDYCDYCNP